jgi:hypothetical protein
MRIIHTMNSAYLIKRLEQAGWVLRGVKRSHHIYTHPTQGGAYQRAASQKGFRRRPCPEALEASRIEMRRRAMRYPIAIELGDKKHAFGVVVPDLPGCFS